MRLAVSIAGLAVVVAACSDRTPTTSPAVVSAGPELAISDGAHAGNPDFFFLPPLQAPPRNKRNFDRGQFNPNLSPTVQICDGRNLTNAGDCATVLRDRNGRAAVYTAVRGWDNLPDWVDPAQYHVLWPTRTFNLVADGKHAYRVVVKVGSVLLGYLDVVPTQSLLGALRISAGGQDVGWIDDLVVPIRFRIEQGALCHAGTTPGNCSETTVVGAAPGSPGDTTINLVTPAKDAALSIPPSAIKPGDTVTIVMEKQAPPYTQGETAQCLPTDLAQSKGCYHYSSDPPLYQFVNPVRMEVCVSPGDLDPEQLQLFKYNTTEGLQQLPWADPTLVDCSGFTAMANPAGSGASSLASAALHRFGRLASLLFMPPPLYAAMPGLPPKGLGGTGNGFSDLGGAIPGTAMQTIDFVQPPPSAVYQNTFTIVAPTATSQLPVAVRATGGCTIAGTTVTMTSGTTACALTASQAGNEVYAPAPDVAWTVSAIKAPQASFTLALPPDATVNQPNLAALASGGSGSGAVTYGASPPVVCTVDANNGSVEAVGPGTCAVTATKAADDDYQVAVASGSFQVTGLTQTITFVQPTSPAAYLSTFTVAPTASSQLPVTVTASGGCTIASGIVTMTSGTNACQLTASQAGDAVYLPAPDVQLTVAASKASQASVVVTLPSDVNIEQTSLTISAQGGSGTGAFTFGYYTPSVCSVGATSGILTLYRFGTCQVRVVRTGDDNYLPSPTQNPSFGVAPVLHAQGTLSIPQTYGADLDEATVPTNYNGSIDIWFHAATDVNRYFQPVFLASTAVFGSTAPGLTGCLGLTLSADSINVNSLQVGEFLCVSTNGGRMSEVEIQQLPGPSPGTLVIGVKTWTYKRY